MIGKLIPGADVVHHVQLVGTQRKFEITTLIRTDWDGFEEDKHQPGSYVLWDLKHAELKVNSTMNFRIIGPGWVRNACTTLFYWSPALAKGSYNFISVSPLVS